VKGCEETVAHAASALAKADALVVTGDLTEFGGLESLGKFDWIFAGVKCPLIPTLGNHDATWRSLHDVFFTRFDRNYYRRDVGPFRVLALDSSTCQDPRPHWDPAQLAWIASEVRTDKWVVPSFHHPPWVSEFASPWARARLAAALDGAPVACMLTGHTHVSATRTWGGMRIVVGGAAQGKDAGYTTVSIDGLKLVARYFQNDGKEKKLCEELLVRSRAPLSWERAVRIEVVGDPSVPGPHGVRGS
jgi:3',5'-cyclic AMP phosphodiesterase CpdA